MNTANGLPAQPQGAFVLRAVAQALTSDPQKLRILIACTLAVMTTSFEPTYLNQSTSFIQAGMRSANSNLPLALAGGFLVLALFTLVVGAAADLFGRRLFLLIGMIGITLSNLLGMLWLHTPQFVIADLLNTVTGVIALPAAIAIVTLTFKPIARPFAYGVIYGLQGVAIVIAPLLISLWGDTWDGRFTFIPVLILGSFAIVMTWRHVPESKAPRTLNRGNVLANLLPIAGIFVLVFLVVTSQIRTGGQFLVFTILMALLVFAAVVRWMANRWRHFKGIEIYSRRDLGLAIFAAVMMVFAQGCFFYQIYPYFIDIQKIGTVEYVLRMALFVVGLILGGLVITRLSLRFDARTILVFCFVLLGLAMLGLSLLKVDSPFWVMIIPITLIGLGTGLGGPARTQVILSTPPQDLTNEAASINTAAGQAGYTLGVIISCALVTKFADLLYLNELTASGVSPEVVGKVSNLLNNFIARFAATSYPRLPEGISNLTNVSYANAYITGMTSMYFIVGIGMFFTALVLYFGMHRGLPATVFADPAAAAALKESN